jgi:hypothetical protein
MTIKNDFFDSLLPASKRKAKILRTVLDNACDDPTISAKMFLNIIAPALKEVVPKMLAHDLVGVQAITKSEDVVKTLRVGLGANNGSPAKPAFLSRICKHVTVCFIGIKFREPRSDLRRIENNILINQCFSIRTVHVGVL